MNMFFRNCAHCVPIRLTPRPDPAVPPADLLSWFAGGRFFVRAVGSRNGLPLAPLEPFRGDLRNIPLVESRVRTYRANLRRGERKRFCRRAQ